MPALSVILAVLTSLSGLTRAAEPALPDWPDRVLFERNGGAYDPAVDFVARMDGMALFACADRVVLRLDGAATGTPAVGVAMGFVGARATTPVGEGAPLATRVHHLRGADPAAWSVGNPTYTRVRYRQLWPGIDLVLYDAGGALEYDVVVAAGVDPGAARIRYEGVDELSLDDQGRLLLTTAAGTLRQSAPVLYQDGPRGREAVPGRFLLHGAGEVGFAVDGHDDSRPLVIDPVLGYATYLGGSDIDYITDIAVDGSGSAYVCGWTRSSDLPTTAGVLFESEVSTTSSNAFVAKLSPDGGQIEWLTYLGGTDPAWPSCCAWTEAETLAVDGTGHVVVGGKTNAVDLPSLGAFDVDFENHSEGFLMRLLPDGSGVTFATYVGGPLSSGSSDERVAAVHVDPAGTIWAAGEVTGPAGHLPTTPGAFDVGTSTWGSDGFVMRLAPTGAVEWCTFLGGSLGQGVPPSTFGPKPRTQIWDLDVDGSGRVYVAGDTNTSDLPTAGAFDATGCDTTDTSEFFVARLSADGSTLDYASFLGGPEHEAADDGLGVAATDDGRLWFAASTHADGYPVTPNAWDGTKNGSASHHDGVVSVLDTTATGAASLLYSTYFGGTGHDVLLDVEVGASGNAYVVGVSGAADYPMLNAWQPEKSDHQDVVLSVFDAAFALTASTFFGGTGAENAGYGALALGPDGDVYLGTVAGSPGLATPWAAQQDFFDTPFAASDGLVTRWRDQDPVCQPDLGHGGPGSAQLDVCGGDLSTGTIAHMTLQSDAPNQVAFLFVGFQYAPTWIPKAGGTLVPVPELAILPLVTDSQGGVDHVIMGGSGPVTLYGQVAVASPASPSGWALSNAVQVDWLP